MYRIQYVGVYPGARSPVVYIDTLTKRSAALEQFNRLFRASVTTGATIAAKLCLNTDKSRPWKGAIILSRFMSTNKEEYSIDTIPKPGSTLEGDRRYELHYYRHCGEYLDKAVTFCNDDALCIDLLLLMEREAKENEYITSYVLVVLDHQKADLVDHVSFRGIDLFFSEFPSVQVGGMPKDRIKEAHRRLFPQSGPEIE